MPTPYELGGGQLSWERRYGSFEQLSLQVTRYFRRWSIYLGGENLTNFKQKNPIIDAANPWGNNFDSIHDLGTGARSKRIYRNTF